MATTKTHPVRLDPRPKPKPPTPKRGEVIYQGLPGGKVWAHLPGATKRRLRVRNDLVDYTAGDRTWGRPNCPDAQFQLALDLIADAVSDEAAMEHHREFALFVLSMLTPNSEWTMTRKSVQDQISATTRKQKSAAASSAKGDGESDPSGAV